MNLMDLGKLLIIQEESANSQLKQSIDKLTSTISNQQKVVAPASTQVTEGKYKYFTETRENFISSGTLFTTSKDVSFKLFKFVTPTEWKTLSIYIDKQLYIQGDFEYYNDIELAYKNDKDEYVFHLQNEDYKDGVKITIDNGINITLFNIIGKISQ